MGNEESFGKIEKIKAKTFRKSLERMVLTLHEYKQGEDKSSETINLILHDSVLSTTIEDSLEYSFEVNKDIYIKLITPSELVIAFSLDKRPVIWKLRSPESSALQELEQALTISKRPMFIQDSNCQRCKEFFSSFKRKHHCRVCGRILCDTCCNNRLVLKTLGYEEKKRTCHECKESLEKMQKLLELS